MREANTTLEILQDRGRRGLPLERIYRHLFDPELYLRAYGKIYRNTGAMTKGTTEETVDGMSLKKIQNIIELLKQERWQWTPVRRTYIPKANGKTRPLGIPTWSNKLLQEVLRNLLETYYEPRFSDLSHGFRPQRGCHTALKAIWLKWNGTIWFIEGDIKGCFDNIDHQVLLKILQRDLHDERLIKLIDGLLKAGYMEDWKYNDTLSGTPQGGIISPLLANIYLTELDRFVEDWLISEYTRGERRQINKVYNRITATISRYRKRGRIEEAKQLARLRDRTPSVEHFDENYRRLRYIRYADDFLLGFIGPRKEAETIRQRLEEYIRENLKLTLSMEKTHITHAGDDKAHFLGYEIGTYPRTNAFRYSNGNIKLLMPQRVIHKVREAYSKAGKVIHRREMARESDYTIITQYQSVLRGLYNYYCLANNVGSRMNHIRWILETSLTKTLANKFKCKVTEIFQRYQVRIAGVPNTLRVIIERGKKKPLIAYFGGIAFTKKKIERIETEKEPEDLTIKDFWTRGTNPRTEVVQRLLADRCELCGAEGVPLEAHHIRKLADLTKNRGRPLPQWRWIMIAKKRKTLMICEKCHDDIHAGQYDGPSPKGSLESRVR
jgi:group II intron reverse transcriptase/maturase